MLLQRPIMALCWASLGMPQTVVAAATTNVSTTIANTTDGFSWANDRPSTILTVLFSSNNTEMTSPTTNSVGSSSSGCFHCRDDLDGDKPVLPEIVLPELLFRNRRRYSQPKSAAPVSTNATVSATI
jgi:hypothetical protein